HGGTRSFNKVSLSIEEVQDQDLESWKLSDVITRYSQRTLVDENLNVWPSLVHYCRPSKAIVSSRPSQSDFVASIRNRVSPTLLRPSLPLAETVLDLSLPRPNRTNLFREQDDILHLTFSPQSLISTLSYNLTHYVLERIDLGFDVMLDLGATINVMSSSVYKSLRLGALEPMGIVVQLANRSILHPFGIMEDVLVQIFLILLGVQKFKSYPELHTYKLDNLDSPGKLRRRYATSLFTIQPNSIICSVKYGREASWAIKVLSNPILLGTFDH
ncbi:hypothetical protein CR513_59686, partial [Mucuna pruriens]